MPLLGQELRPRPKLPLLLQHLLALLLAPGGAVGEVLDEALFIFLALPPRGGLAASTLSTPAPGLDSGLACAVSRRAVRGSADPALRAPPRETDQVYTGFAMGVKEAEKVCSKFTCRFAYSGKKFTLGLHLVCNWFTGSRKRSHVSLHSTQKSLHLTQ